MLVKAKVTCYCKEERVYDPEKESDAYYYSQKADCPLCLHDSIICGWTVETKKNGCAEHEDFEIFDNIVFMRPGDGFVEIILKRAVCEPFNVFFNLYAPNELKNANEKSSDVSSGV
jgi:hypothetical protein